MFSRTKNFIVIVFIIYFIPFLSGQINLNNKIVKDAARKLGVPASQIKKMIPKTELNNVLKKDLPDKNFIKNVESVKEIKAAFDTDKSNKSYTGNKLTFPDAIINNSLDKKEIIIDEIINAKNKYFGYNVFKGNPELFQKSLDISTDGDYLIGPADEIIIMLWGDTELNSNYFVSKDGYLFIENVGQVFVNGLSLEELESKLLKLLKKSYSSLDASSGNATTFFDVSLGSAAMRPVRIFMLGELIQPGAYNVKSTTSLFNSLYYCNGPSLNGSLRTIKLLQKGKEVAEIDYYDYLLSGKKTNDIKLQRDDVVFIPNRGKTIELIGEIRRPSIYELKEDESLYDLIKIGGGLKISTYMKRAQIKRIVPPSERASSGIDRTLLDVSLFDVMSKKINVEMVDGDKITFFTISDDIKNTVKVQGAVQMPGTYEISDGLDVIKLINKTNGFVGDIFLDRADIIRTNKDYSKTQITVNLKKSLDGDPKHNIKLKTNDVITFYNSSDLFSKGSVAISGYVLNPGKTILRQNLNVEDLVFIGGGFKNEERLNEVFLDRADLFRVINRNDKKIIPFRLDSVLMGRGIAKMNLIDGDEIRVYTKFEINGLWPKVVKISGNIKKPGTYTLYDGMKIRDLLRLGAGFEDSVFTQRIFMERADLYRKNIGFEKYSIKKFNLSNVMDDKKKDANFLLIPDDEIVIHSKKDFFEDDSITIEGVKNSGSYKFKYGMNFGDLFLESGGLDQKIIKFRVEVFGHKDKIDGEKIGLHYFDVKNVSIADYSKVDGFKYPLKKSDYIRIRPYEPGIIEKLVNVKGEVNLPGAYAIIKNSEKVSDILIRAGGLTAESYPLASLFIRNEDTVRVSFEKILKYPKSKQNFTVFDKDEIIIKSKPNVVKIFGGVNSPGSFQYLPNQRLKKYIMVAGGLSPQAFRKASYIKYPNGISKRLSYFSSPIVEDGSIIYIGIKPESEPFSLSRWATDVSAIFADFSQAYLILSLIGQNTN